MALLAGLEAVGVPFGLDDRAFTEIGVGAAVLVALLLARAAWIARQALPRSRPRRAV